MTGRRVAGALVGLLMLHLSFVRADVACAAHGDRHGRATSAMQHHTASHAHGTPSESQGREKPCDTPRQADCCQALASCALLLAFNGDDGASSIVSAHDAVRGAVVSIPLSLIVPPDPPPPKA
jgi:hypothetical protein